VSVQYGDDGSAEAGPQFTGRVAVIDKAKLCPVVRRMVGHVVDSLSDGDHAGEDDEVEVGVGVTCSVTESERRRGVVQLYCTNIWRGRGRRTTIRVGGGGTIAAKANGVSSARWAPAPKITRWLGSRIPSWTRGAGRRAPGTVEVWR